MKFVFPITKEDGKEFPDQQSLETQVQKEENGQFGYNPANKSWHGGIHFTKKNAKWVKNQRPIRAIADGKVVACRIGSDYQTTEFNCHISKYSNDFCLIEHEMSYKEGKTDKSFTFYSLYKHLAPHCEPHAAISLCRRYVISEPRNARAHAGLSGDSVKLEKGVVLEETDCESQIKDNYEFRQFKVVGNPSDGKGIADTGLNIWLAVRETKNLMPSFATKIEKLPGQYKMTRSDRNVRKQAGLEGSAETLHTGTIIEVLDEAGISKDGYEFRIIKIIDNKGTATDLIDNGVKVWLAVSEIKHARNLLKTFATKIKTEEDDNISGQYKMTKSDRRVRKEAGLDGDSETLFTGTIIEAVDDSVDVKDGYDFHEFKIVENKGTDTNIIKNGAHVWLACRDSQDIFPSFTCEASPDWMVHGVIAKVTTNMIVRSDPDPKTKNIGDKIASIKSGTRIFYQKTQNHDWFFLNGKKRLFALCKFIDNDVEIAKGRSLETGWLCIESTYIQPLARKTLELDTLHSLSSSSPYIVKAGDPIGYLGRYDKLNTQKENSFDPEYQIHFEVLSKERPPVGFFERLMDKDSIEKLRWIKDEDSDGFIDKPDPPFLFQEVTRLVTKSDDVQTTEQTKDALLPWDSFRTIVAYHESEWYLNSSEKPFLDDLLEKYRHPQMPDIINHEKQRIDSLIWMQEEKKINFDRCAWHWWPIFRNGISPEEARVRAFLRMIRVGEGTIGEKGYETLFGGESFIKDYKKDWSTHPKILIKTKAFNSTAAGAYQVMGYTWDDPMMKKLREKKYSNLILDFSPLSQDYFCIALLKYKVKGFSGEIKIKVNNKEVIKKYNEKFYVDGKRQSALDLIIRGEIDKAVKVSAFVWASLPPGVYGQPKKEEKEVMKLYNNYLLEEKSGVSDLHLPQGFLEYFK
ncbi:glycoside hydrolase family 24 protein [Vibrio mangrovi]|nr:glycoside hydrolase family 104 protein [Vibrio mangrovi]MDW6001375.1 glycoside hydrolase family 104 protein [Vibrio mangrovi]